MRMTARWTSRSCPATSRGRTSTRVVDAANPTLLGGGGVDGLAEGVERVVLVPFGARAQAAFESALAG